MARKKKPIAKILPREPLTEKARAGIKTYAMHRSTIHIIDFLVKHVLAAERMRRTDLYEWLKQHGYRWNSAIKIWRRL